MIVQRAPGKLFIAGEYAVVEPGHPAVVVAVDRFITVALSATDAHQLTVLRSQLRGGITMRCTRDAGRMVPVDPDDPALGDFSPVLAAIAVVERLAVERGLAPRSFELSVTGTLAHPDGRKLGLGSSAAVTVATVAAVGHHYRLELSPMDRYRLAMLATIAVNPNTSGGDVAASTWGGWIAYHAPDRHRVSTMAARHGVHAVLHADWPELRVRRLPAPPSLRLHVGWTGEPASTAAMMTRSRPTNCCFTEFLTESAASVRQLIDALETDDPAAAQREIRRSRRILSRFDSATSMGIMTPRLETLCSAAESVGAAAKPSGAGGGDCGIALLRHDSSGASAELVDRWTRSGIEPLALQVHLPHQEFQ